MSCGYTWGSHYSPSSSSS
jgi:hypothetical protein